MSDKDLTQLIDEYEGNPDLTAPLPTELPESYSDTALKPVLTTADDKMLEEYRVRLAAQEMDVDPDLMAGIALHESGFQPKAVSKTGVKGLLQVTERTANKLGYNRNIPNENIRAGVAEVKRLIDLNKGNVKAALTGYPAPQDVRTWVPTVLGHAERAKKIREITPKTVEEALAEIPDNIFDISPEELAPIQEAPLNAPGSQITNVNPELGVTPLPTSSTGRIVPGPLGTEVSLPSWSQMGGDIATIASILLGGPATGALTKGVSKIPAVAKALTPIAKEGITKLPKMGQAIKTAIQSLYGAGASAGIQVAKGEPENILEAAAYGAAIPVGLKGIGTGIKAVANKAGDLTLGRWNVGKFVNEKFGGTKSMKSLATKNTAAKEDLEITLQDKLSQYEGNRIQLNPVEVDANTLKHLRRAAVRADDKMGIALYDDFISRFNAKEGIVGDFTPAELNLVKRNMYDLAYSYKGDPLTSKAAKEFKSKAQYVRKLIEDSTDETVALLNEEYAKHITLDRAISHQLGLKPGSWSWLGNLAAKAFIAGGATTLGGPIATGTALAAQTVPGFTTIGAAGKAIQNPELIKILSTLLPQFMQNEEPTIPVEGVPVSSNVPTTPVQIPSSIEYILNNLTNKI